jgi:hypothetical protein
MNNIETSNMSFGLHTHVITKGKDEPHCKWLCSMLLPIEPGYKDPNSTFTRFKALSSTFTSFKQHNAFNLEVPKGGRWNLLED